MLGTSTRSIPQTPARASSALGLWGSPGSIPVPGAGVSAGVCGAGSNVRPGLVTRPWLLFPWEHGQQGRVGCPPARRLRLRCRHRHLECWGGRPQLTRASCFPQQQGRGLLRPPPPGHPTPHVGTVLGDSTPGH